MAAISATARSRSPADRAGRRAPAHPRGHRPGPDADLARPGAAADLVAELTTHRIAVDILVNNAGFGAHGDLVDTPPERLDAMTALNVDAVVGLTSRLLPGMVERKAGAIINLASTAAFQPIPHMAVYGATKAFVLSFSRALWAETKDSGVAVLALSPGATDTEFFQVAGEDAAVGPRRSTAQVVGTALRALAQGRPRPPQRPGWRGCRRLRAAGDRGRRAHRPTGSLTERISGAATAEFPET
ncbi:MAG: SDR family NAD(P)-dependent oxidoreductase [Nakamurella multipartita]